MYAMSQIKVANYIYIDRQSIYRYNNLHNIDYAALHELFQCICIAINVITWHYYVTSIYDSD